jgi:zinc/manganese transport system substrate-binding protein
MSLAACESSSATSEDGRVKIVASTDVYGDIAATVGGDQVDVTSLISSPDQDPHSYESNTRDILAVSHADIVIENGGGYDDFMERLLDSASGDPTVLNAVDISGHTPPAGGQLNEHVWYDIPTIVALASDLESALAADDPGHAQTFAANARHLTAQLTRLVDREAELRRTLKGAGVGITEPVPGYMLDALGLVNRTPAAFSEAVEEGEDVSVSVLDQTLSLYTHHQVDALVYNEQTAGAITDQVEGAATGAGIPVVGVTETLPSGESYVGWMSSNLDNLQQALAP